MRGWGALLFVVACGGSSQQEAKEPPTRKEILADMRANVVLPECKGDTDGTKACGLLAVDWSQRPFIESFVQNHCVGGLDDKCRELMRESFHQALTRRYDRASEHDVEARCRAELDCGPYDLYELKWLESHNARVFSAARRSLDERDEYVRQYNAAVEAQQQRTRAVLAGIAAGLQGAGNALQNTNDNGPSCTNSYGCDVGYSCVVPQGSYQGHCAKVR